MAAVRRSRFTDILFGGVKRPITTRVGAAKSLLDRYTPYTKEVDANNDDYIIFLLPHFKKSLIDALSWEGTDFDMSPPEIALYRAYSRWLMDKDTICISEEYELYRAVNAIDAFVLQEIYTSPCRSHETLYTRAYNLTGADKDLYGNM